MLYLNYLKEKIIQRNEVLFITSEWILLLFLLLLNVSLLAEGTSSIAPSVEDEAAIYVGAGNTGSRGGDYGLFAWKDSDSRLFFNIQETCEKVYLGFSIPKTSRNYNTINNGNPGFSEELLFRIVQPNGQPINDLACLGNTTIDGVVWQTLTQMDVNLTDRSQTDAGPMPLSPSGYDPFVLDLSACGLNLTGDYFIEFFTTDPNYNPNTSASGFHIELFDITVANCNNMGQTGRVWSNNWGLSIRADGEGSFDRAFNGAFYVCSNEGFISKIDFNSGTNNRVGPGRDTDQKSGFRAGSFNVSFNSTGTGNTGDILMDRLSLPDVNAPNPELAVFLNLPDEAICPEQPIGQFRQMEEFVTGCADSRCINMATTQIGQIDILLERLNGNGILDQPEERRIAFDISEENRVENPETPGFNYQFCIPWDGKDQQGNFWNINDLKISGFYRQGIYHFPAYDAEFNDDGFIIETVRPALGIQDIYYDDTRITENNNTGESKDGADGCLSPCHRWTGEWEDIPNSDDVYGNFNTINTWWFGNTVLQEFFVEQIEPLTFVCPPDFQGCFEEATEPANTGSPTGASLTADCVKLDYQDVIMDDPDCPGGQRIERIWTAFVEGLEADKVTCVQIIRITGQNPPEFSSQPEDLTLSCEETIPVTNITANSLCNNSTVDLDFTEATLPGNCPNNYTIERVWTATDNCGNVASLTQTITLRDITPPTILVDLPDLVLSCDAEIPEATDIMVRENCGDDMVMITFTDEESTQDDNCTGRKDILRTYTVMDLCGNGAKQEQKISFVDDIPPVLFNIPADFAASCGVIPAPPDNIMATDNCTESENISIEFTEVVSTDECVGNQSVKRTWTAVDACGNRVTAEQTITIRDNEPPVISGVPGDITLSCEVNPPAPSVVTAIDNCGTATVSFEEQEIIGNCPNNRTIKRIWTSVDDCGNTTIAEQLISFVDDQAPILSNIPADITLSCTQEAASPSLVSATDNCEEVAVVFSEELIVGNCPNNKTIKRTWTAVDACGNATSAEQVITFIDNRPPTLVGVPLDKTLSCALQVDVPSLVTAMDDCDAVDVVFSESIVDGDCPNNKTIKRTWTTADACGNATSAEQVITIVDDIPPILVGVPLDMNLSCTEQISDPGPVSATDNCVDVAVVFVENITEGNCTNETEIRRTWTATDRCGNATSATQVITIMDNIPPQFLDCGKTITVTLQEGECEAKNVPIIAPPATDNCMGGVTVSSSRDLTAPFPLGLTSVIFTATDACGNSITCEYLVAIKNPPIDDCPEDILIPCDENLEGAIVSWDPPNGNECCYACSDVTGNEDFIYLGLRGGHKYYLSSKKGDWQAATFGAHQIGGSLAIINDPAENAFLSSFLAKNQSAFIGLSDATTPNDFFWWDGAPLTYENWQINEPNNEDGGEHFVRMITSGEWKVIKADAWLYYFVEVVCADVKQTSGPLNGSLFTEGTTTISYTIDYPQCINSDQCEFEVTVEECPPKYCQSSGQAKCFWIDRIALVDLDHTSGNNGGYGDFTDMTVNLTPGKPETMLLKPAFAPGHFYDLNWTLFIDFNRDGDFEDENELVFTKSENRVFHNKGDAPVLQDFTIPLGASPGVTRMRVAMKFSNKIDPCERFSFGEVLDYSVNILPVGGRIKDVDHPTILLTENNKEENKNLFNQNTNNPNLKLAIYPNPVRTILSVNLENVLMEEGQQASFTIYNHVGQLVHTQRLLNLQPASIQIDVQHLPSGLYFLTFDNKLGIVGTKKFTKF